MKKSPSQISRLFSILCISTITYTLIPAPNTPPGTRGPLDYNNATPLTITKPGIYKITGNMSASGVPVVQITADNVTLDLNGNTLGGGTTGISISGNYVTIKNGTIQNPTDTGITLENAIGCNIDNCDIIGSATGIYLNNAHQNIITNIRSLSATNAGFSLVSSCTNYFEQCYAQNIANSNGNAYGFISENGSLNTLNKCYSSGISATTKSIINVPGFTTISSGFTLLGNEQNSSLIECFVNNTHCLAPNNSTAYGITLQPILSGFLSESTLVTSTTNPTTVKSITWIENGTDKFLASSNVDNNEITIYYSSGGLSSLETITSTSSITSESIVWLSDTFQYPPSNNYLAAIDSNSDLLRIFSFDGTSLDAAASILIVYGTPITLDYVEYSGSLYIAVSSSGDGNIAIFEYTAPASLNFVTTEIAGSSPYALKWFTYGGTTYLASGGTLTTSPLKIFSFNGSTLTEVTSLSINGNIRDIAWDGTSNFSIVYDDTQNYLSVVNFNGSTLSTTDTIALQETKYAASWFNANYIVTGGKATNNNELGIFNFNGSTLSAVTSSGTDGTIYSLDLTTESYIATGGKSPQQLHIFTFDGSNTITEITSTAEAGFPIYATSWLTHNGVSYLAKGGAISADSTSRIEVLSFDGTSLFSTATNNTPEGNIYSTAWIVDNGTTYLATGGDASLGTNELNVFSFDGSTLSGVATSTAPDGPVYGIDWIHYNDTSYLATGGDGPDELKIFSFNESNLSEIASYIADGTIRAVSWLIYNNTPYIATGGEGTNEIHIFSFDGNSLTPVTASAADGTVYSVAWLNYNGAVYLATGGEGTNKISLFSFDGSTLIPITTSSDPDGTVNSLRWLFYANTFYLTAGGAAASGDNEIKLLSFDGSSLTPIITSNSPDGTVNTIDWLLLDNTPYLASGGQGIDNQLQILEFSGSTTSLWPTNCTVKNCTAQNVSATIASISDDGIPGTGIGIKADSTQNFIASNYADNNTTNYQDIESDYITSQANARGIYNIDGALDAADQIPDILNKSDIIYNESWSIESKCEHISSKIDFIPSQYPIELGTTPRIALTDKTISQPGSYFLRENIAGDISITATNVILDLNGFTVDGNTIGIHITGNNVVIKNGKIKNATTGIKLDSVTDCTIQECDIATADTSISLYNSNYNKCKNVRTTNSSDAGFSLVSSNANYFEKCKALKTQSTSNAYGFASEQGSNNVFYQCQAHDISSSGGSTTTSVTSSGFSFTNLEHDSACIECIVNDVQTTAGPFNFVAGITCDNLKTLNTIDTDSTPSTYTWSTKWLEYDGKTYLAVTANTNHIYIYELSNNSLILLLNETSFFDTVIYDCDWLIYNNTPYLATTGYQGTVSRAAVYQFTPSTPAISNVDLVSFADSGGPTLRAANWQIINNTPYLSVAGKYINLGSRIYSFNGSSLSLIYTYSPANTGSIYDTDWLNVNGSYYLALGNNSSASKVITILEFVSETTLTERISHTTSSSDTVWSVSWLTYNDNYYLAAAFNGGSGSIQVQVFQFNPSGPSLTLIDSYTWLGTLVYSVDWILASDGTPYLAAAGRRTTSPFNVRVFTFDGSSLTVITEKNAPESTSSPAIPTGWLEQDNILYLALGTTDPDQEVQLFTFAGVQNCTIKNCITENVTTTTAYTNNNLGIGIKADSSQNSILSNYSCDNDLNYKYVSQQYLSSKANMHGTDNVDCSRTEVDEYNSKLDVIINNIP